MKPSAVRLTTWARDDIHTIPWDDRVELGGHLFGRAGAAGVGIVVEALYGTSRGSRYVVGDENHVMMGRNGELAHDLREAAAMLPVGVWHSHPGGPQHLSRGDIDTASSPGSSPTATSAVRPIALILEPGKDF